MTPQPAVAATLTRWQHPTLKSEKKKQALLLRLEKIQITFGNARVLL